jgi:hypothetical protein
MEQLKKQLPFIALAALLVVSGAIIGHYSGTFFVRDFLRGGRGYILVSVPSSEIMNVFHGIESSNEQERAASWYELSRMKLADESLLKEAYASETVPFVRRVILFAMKQLDPVAWSEFCHNLPDDQKPFTQSENHREKPFQL